MVFRWRFVSDFLPFFLICSVFLGLLLERDFFRRALNNSNIDGSCYKYTEYRIRSNISKSNSAATSKNQFVHRFPWPRNACTNDKMNTKKTFAINVSPFVNFYFEHWSVQNGRSSRLRFQLSLVHTVARANIRHERARYRLTRRYSISLLPIAGHLVLQLHHSQSVLTCSFTCETLDTCRHGGAESGAAPTSFSRSECHFCATCCFSTALMVAPS